ncbi:alanine--tRNA ligase [Buchnera aphidicola (Astegopteryx bambusae)]|uniref:alanine--tRNA ligase n=1 Tax=Buchnera aphidicola TaxID=9 RepID=UPI0031B83972
MKTKKIKKIFLNFFKQNNHKIIKGSSIIPKKDNTLLFTNAGMNQFKNYFLEKKKIKYKKIVTSQKCIRTGGKDDDIRKVGNTPYHHTSFEMLGNFSFGGYSKKQAILYAWNILTNKKYFNLNKNKIFVTVNYKDKETYNIWSKIIKVSKKNIKNTKKDSSENFWEMGKTGPCGPSTEIYYKKKYIEKKKKKNMLVEIWNIVFIQYNKISKNKLIKLNNLYIDTGMGLERIAHILQKVNSTYEIDIFKKIKKKIIKISDKKKICKKFINIIIDHIRTIYFITLEKINPSNKHQGYILKKIIRRTLLYGEKLKIKSPFLYKLIKKIINKKNNNKIKLYKKNIKNILKEEEKTFKNTIKTGILYLNKKIKNKNINESTVFYLYDTLGLPIDLTIKICKKNFIKIDKKKILQIIEENKNKNKKNKFLKKTYASYNFFTKATKFLGYEKNKTTSIIKEIYIKKNKKKNILYQESGIIILNKTTFYGKSSGQIGDSGKIYNKKSIFLVEKTEKTNNIILHIGKVIKGNFSVKDKVISKIDTNNRSCIQANHTSTHILHKSLKQILGEEIVQKGSNIKKKYFTFDFSYSKKILETEIYKIEKIVNKEIQKNHFVKKEIIDKKRYLEKYKKKVLEKKYNTIRIVKIGKFSSELCAGTHVNYTGEIGIFKISKIYKISNANYRIKAVTKNYALKKICTNQNIINLISKKIKVTKKNILEKIHSICKKNKLLEKKIFSLKKKLFNKKIKKILNNRIKINKYFLIIKFFINEKNILLRNLIDKIEKKNNKIIIIFGNIKKENIYIIIKITKQLSNKINAIKILKKINMQTGGKGGGNKKFAQGGNKNITLTKKILKNIKVWFPYK